MSGTTRSARKRARSLSSPPQRSAASPAPVSFTLSHKRRAVVSSAAARPTPRRVSVRIEVSESPPAPPRVQQTTADSYQAPTHGDDPPSHACYICRKRGGLYPWTCVFEEGSTNCTKCIEQKMPCRAATPAQIATLNARCQQCKSRGLAVCVYADGQAWQAGDIPCAACVRWKKGHRCGKPIPRKVPSNTAVPDEDPQRGSGQRSLLVANQNKPAISGGAAVSSMIPRRPRRNTQKETSLDKASSGQSSGHKLQTQKATNSVFRKDHSATINSTRSARSRQAGTSVVSQGKAAFSDDTDAASRQLIIEASQLTLPSPPTTGSDTEGDIPAYAPSPDVEKINPMENDTSEPDTSVSNRTSSRARRSTTNYGQSYARMSLDLSDHESTEDFSPYEEDAEGEEEAESDDDGDEASSNGMSEEDENEEMISDSEVVPEPKTKTTKSKPSRSKPARKAINYDLPPMHDHVSIFNDLTSRAVKEGLAKALKKLDRPINVATMCSGTESPLFGLMASASALKTQNQDCLRFRHVFSAEIEQFKQAFIERNWMPELLFRDIREFIDEGATTATTAYGAIEAIPKDVDMLVAGFSCKNLSRQNNHRKSLKENGESGETWMAVYEYSRRFRPRVVLLENVKSTAATWNDLVSQWSDIGYEAAWTYCDTKRYYLPQTRERMYMIAVDRNHAGKNAGQAVERWKSIMQNLERPCSSPYEDFVAHFPPGSVDYSALTSEWSWELCKLRYDHIRSDLRLGIKRPCTKWSENGTKQPLDHADHDWFHSRSSREWEAIEVAYLRVAVVDGTDVSYKYVIWDVSQNADRFHENPGVVSCITPNGQVFSTNRQQPLSGMELLGLQGLPLDKIHLGRETAADLQDLAGNAMSTTVIAASQLSAIICAANFFGPSAHQERTLDLSPPISKLVRPEMMSSFVPNLVEPGSIDVNSLILQAQQSSRLCSRECNETFCEANVQRCSACGHTACASHAGNPRHYYANMLSGESLQQRQRPSVFVNEWRPKLPTRIIFKNFSGYSFSHSFNLHAGHDDLTKEFRDRINEVQIEGNHFYIGEFSRHLGLWKVTYKSEHAQLELCIGGELQWLLYVHCPAELPGNSALRTLLKFPVARGLVKDSLLAVEWDIFVPWVHSIPLRIHRSSRTYKSFRNTLGLLDFQSETVPATLHISMDEDDTTDTFDLSGAYEHLPHCGTASNSLYKRTSNPPLYFYLDSDPLSFGNDSFHFAESCEREPVGQRHQSLARLDPTWRHWNIPISGDESVSAVASGKWERADAGTIILAPDELPLRVNVLPEPGALTLDRDVCNKATIVLEVDTTEVLHTAKIDDYMWALGNTTTAPAQPCWQPLGIASNINCECAPANPRLLWSINQSGIATAYENPKEAALRERAIKTRCPTFEIEAKATSQATHFKFGVNISSLAHRAVQNLIGTKRSTPTKAINVAWRLLTNQNRETSLSFPEFRLQSNAIDKPFSENLRLMHELRGAQPRALQWMRTQEAGVTFTLTEVEESIHEKLGWRAEARAQAETLVRGGVLADRPSFGKTVLTIALVQSEFEEFGDDESIIKHNTLASSSALATEQTLIDTAATLIVCPPHLVDQWQKEFIKFLGDDMCEIYSIITITTFEELENIGLEEVKSARVIIVSWALFAEPDYITHLAGFAAMPEPATASNVKGAPNSRAFNAWMDRVSQELPPQLAEYQRNSEANFRERTEKKLRHNLSQDDFKVSLPVELRQGGQYQPYTATTKTNAKAKSKKAKICSFSVALLHLFRFNRIVVDEYHYLNVTQKEQKKAHDNLLASVSIKSISAHKRWVLSGTPALGAFVDVDNIASYLGIRLGRYSDRATTGKRTQAEEIQLNAQTKVERFLSQKEIMSHQWHQARHELAQKFLDHFVRQNEPSLEHIHCSESLQAIELDVAHHAVYLELSQHLISQRMALKRMRHAEGTDRANRLNASLNGASTGEDALLKCALVYASPDGQSGLQKLLDTRSAEYRETISELKILLRGFEGYRKNKFKGLQKGEKEEAPVSQLYEYFKKDVCIENWLGDGEASAKIRSLVKDAVAKPDRHGFIEGKTPDEKIKNAKKALSKLRTTANHLAFRIRSERFISNIQSLLQPLCEGSESNAPITCDAPECRGLATIIDIYLTSNCGHMLCGPCLSASTDADADADAEICAVSGCNATVQDLNLIKATHIGSQQHDGRGKSFGRKLDSVARLIKEFPDDDQALVFAPDAGTMNELKQILDHHRITYLAPSEKFPAKAIQRFKTSPGVKVLILDLTSESAAGVNLYNANHIIFVAPILVASQYEYDAAMEQAIARSRRYGQEKKVHIYHFAALRTVDVDILEHRHRRKDGITDLTAPVPLPPAHLDTREKTRLVKNDQGNVALVPISWLQDERVREKMGVDEDPDKFTSLINFSKDF